jgi:L-aminopeptidase/D-esterase-like protein
MTRFWPVAFLASIAFVTAPAAQTDRVRARDLGIVVGTLPPGPLNGVTDVAGVLVGHATIVQGNGALKIGEGPVRTGVTAVLPRKDVWFNGVYAATHTSVATDAPLSSRQLERLASRAALGLARTGSTSGNTSGDIFIAFSTANTVPQSTSSPTVSATFISPKSTGTLNPLFQAVVEATEESVLNALSKAETMTGINGNRVHALPYDRLAAAMSKFGRR